jgi:hypothetical protein
LLKNKKKMICFLSIHFFFFFLVRSLVCADVSRNWSWKHFVLVKTNVLWEGKKQDKEKIKELCTSKWFMQAFLPVLSNKNVHISMLHIWPNPTQVAFKISKFPSICLLSSIWFLGQIWARSSDSGQGKLGMGRKRKPL